MTGAEGPVPSEIPSEALKTAVTLPDPERLIEIVAEEVARALRPSAQAGPSAPPSAQNWQPGPPGPARPARSKAPPGPLFLFTGPVKVEDGVWAAAAELAQAARVASAFLSRSFLDHTRESEAASRLAGVALQTPPLSERQALALAEAHAALIIPALSPNTAAKAALGIHDSEPSQLLRLMLQMRKPIVALRAPLEPKAEGCPLGVVASAPPGFLQTINAHRLALERMGVRFVDLADLAAEGLKALAPPDDRPRTLPAPKPPLKRNFVTEDDLRGLKAKGQTVFQIGPLTIVTDVAREYAAREEIELRYVGG